MASHSSQEINHNEIDWFESIGRSFPKYDVYVSSNINRKEYLDIYYNDAKYQIDNMLGSSPPPTYKDELHLDTAIRSYSHVSEFVRLLLDCDSKKAKDVLEDINEYLIMVTRSFEFAKK